MNYDIRNVKNTTDLITYFSINLGWDIDIDSFDDIEDISYDFEAEDIGLKEENFAKISSLRQLQPLVDGQQWGIFCIEFDSNKFEVSALRKILSALVPRRRCSADHAVWEQQDLLFICNWGEDNNRTIGIAHFEDRENGLPQIKMISCAPALEDFTQIKVFEDRLSQLAWPKTPKNIDAWREDWSNAFFSGYRQTIQDSSTLTIKLAAEAQEIRNRILATLAVETKNGYVHLLYDKFRDTLIHDMTEQQFADMYAQTVVYGLFSARCMDSTQDNFSADEAVDCIPSTNPFLKSLMKECLGSEGKTKLSFDELEIGNVVELLLHSKTDEIIKDFNRQTGGGREDPVIHFYEEFLTAYDKSQKVQRGVYYTPQPVVNFIVRAVDTILKTEFGYEDGLASTETKKIKVMRDSRRRVNGYKTQIEEQIDVPAVQILDPATGTGTFLRQTILQIYENFQQKHKGEPKATVAELWNKYVDESLLPRLNGFELMMAPYAVAHMKLAMVLKDTGYDFSGEHRLNVFLTNSLEKAGNSENQLTLFDDPLATESIEANKAKKNSGINVIIGNPPYSCESANNIEWIQTLMEDFKKEPGGLIRLQEQNYKAINDDYVKFTRYAIEQVASSESAVISFIMPHGFLDNPTFRGMRWQLLQAFSSLYIVELHGDMRRKETCPDGSKDDNVFDIQQGVCIFIGVKKKTTKTCTVYRTDLFGVRETKYAWLNSQNVTDICWTKLPISEPYYFFYKQKTDHLAEYNEGFSIRDLFCQDVMGVATARDSIVIDSDRERLISKFKRIGDLSIDDYQIADMLFPGKQEKANINGASGWSLTEARKSIATLEIENYVYPISYRPFDKRYIFYYQSWIDRGREEIMRHFIAGENLGLCLIRINRDDMCTVLVSDAITDKTILSSKDNANVFPLFIYDDNSFVGTIRANLDSSILKKIEQALGLTFVFQEDADQTRLFSAYDLVDYIYAILHSESYREKYKDLLKSEFPKIPYPKDKGIFWRLVEYGKRLRLIHLMKDETILGDEYEFVGTGTNIVDKASYKNGAIYINKSQRFVNVDDETWNYYLAAYQPLQKWMKDRKGCQLSKEEICHYKKMIASLVATRKIMQEIETVLSF